MLSLSLLLHRVLITSGLLSGHRIMACSCAAPLLPTAGIDSVQSVPLDYHHLHSDERPVPGIIVYPDSRCRFYIPHILSVKYSTCVGDNSTGELTKSGKCQGDFPVTDKKWSREYCPEPC